MENWILLLLKNHIKLLDTLQYFRYKTQIRYEQQHIRHNRSSHQRCSVKKMFLKISQSVKFVKFLRTPILKNTCEQLLLYEFHSGQFRHKKCHFCHPSFSLFWKTVGILEGECKLKVISLTSDESSNDPRSNNQWSKYIRKYETCHRYLLWRK